MTTPTPIFHLRLGAAHRQMATEAALALTTPLHPSVSIADVIRYALSDLHGRLVLSHENPTPATTVPGGRP